MDEALLTELLERGDHEAVTTLILRELGRDLFGFVCSRVRNRAEAEDAYADFCVDFWRGLPGFRRHCSFKAWAYTLARNAALRALERRVSPRQRELGLSQLTPGLEALVRTTTAPYLRTDTHDAFAALREQLSEQEQTLLTLRVDKELDWKDVAAVVLGPVDPPELQREAARLRQQFRSLKRKLADMAKDAGLFVEEQHQD